MEGAEHSQFQTQTLEGVVDDAKVERAGKEAAAFRKAFHEIDSFQPRDENNGVSIREGSHLDAELATCRRKSSSSTQFMVNVESTNALSFDEIDCCHIGVSSEGNLPSNDALGRSTSIFNAEDPTSDQSQPGDEYSQSCSSTKIHLEPTIPISLKFEDVKYKVPQVKGKKSSDDNEYILHGITGLVHPGEVLALMAPSGGGKTTLLNLLSGRVKFDSGTITYNDQPYSKSLKRRIGFVLQDDVFFPHLTVKETLTYAALLRLPNTITVQKKKERAMTVISELELERCQNTVIGGTFFRGISGGERKRVCIANEILLNPSLLFLDEPTSGLDSTTALHIVQTLHSIARSGKTVVTTIHQPSSRLFRIFDKLILMGKGSSLYFGKASEAMLYFSSVGCSPLIAMNPAEFLIDLANGNIKDKSVPSDLEDKSSPRQKRCLEMKNGEPSQVDIHEYLVEAYTERIAKLEIKRFLNPVLIDPERNMSTMLRSKEWGATWWDQFKILFKRGLKERRHEYFSCMRVIQVLSTAVIMGLLWWRSDASSPKGLQDQAGVLFFISVFWAFFPMFTAIFTFPQERVMIAKERSVGMYRLTAYFFARMTGDISFDLILPQGFLVLFYIMVGLKPTFAAFSQTMLTVFLSVVAAQGLGLAIGAALMDVKKAATFASVTIMASMLSGGFFIQKVPAFISWVRYISLTYHSFRMLLKIHYGCSDLDIVSDSCKSPFKGLQLNWGGIEVGTIIGIIVGYRLLAYVFLRRMK